MLRVGSLFSGIGGLELGLERAGMEVAWQVESDEYCRRVLARHWPDVERWDDVATFPPDADEHALRIESGRWEHGTRPERTNESATNGDYGQMGQWFVDLICGGFPCQPVSHAGKRAGDEDARWLWPEMRRVCSILRPRWVLAENVPGLLSASSGRLFGGVVRDLAALGYDVRWDCVPAAAVGAPHIRDRVFIVGRLYPDRDEPGSLLGSSDGEPQEGVDEPRRDDAAGLREDVPDAGRRLLQDSGPAGPSTGATQRPGCWDSAAWWAIEPDVGRVADGVPVRVDRLRALGNAVVPQVSELIGRAIMAAEMETT